MDCDLTCTLIFHIDESHLVRKNQDRKNITASDPALYIYVFIKEESSS